MKDKRILHFLIKVLYNYLLMKQQMVCELKDENINVFSGAGYYSRVENTIRGTKFELVEWMKLIANRRQIL